MSKPLCAVRGLVQPGAMCSKVILAKHCGHAGPCEHQREQPEGGPAIQPVTLRKTLKTCLGCGQRHPFNADGTPVGGALPCGH